MKSLNYQKGQKFLDMFTNDNIFASVKKIIEQYITKPKDLENLNNCNNYRLDILNGKIERLEFNFGDGSDLGFVRITPDGFTVEKLDGRVIMDINTHVMIEVWNELNK